MKATHRAWWLSYLWRRSWLTLLSAVIRIKICATALNIAIVIRAPSHSSIALIMIYRALWAIYRHLVHINPHAVAMGILIG